MHSETVTAAAPPFSLTSGSDVEKARYSLYNTLNFVVLRQKAEELGLAEGWISREQVHSTGAELDKTLYGKYLMSL